MEFNKEFVTLEEVLNAYKDCRKHKHNKRACIEFEMNEAENLVKLWEELNNGTYEIGFSDTFIVTRPKHREVFAADFRDRIVHHIIINRTNKLFEEYFIEDTYNCRKGKGTLYGVKRLHEQLKQISNNFTEDCYILKCDLKGFFMSIDKRLLWKMLEKFLKEQYKGEDIEWLLWITKMVVMHRPELKCIKKCSKKLWRHIEKSKSLFWNGKWFGMAIGNLTSQIFANFFLTILDKFVKRFKCVGYGRYVDDFGIIAKNKRVLMMLMCQIRKYIQKHLKVTLHPNKWYIQHYSKGVNIIGATIKRERLYAGNRLVYNAFNFVETTKFDGDIERYIQRYNSYTGYMCHFRTYNIRKRLYESLPQEVTKLTYINSDFKVLKIRQKCKPKYKLLQILKEDKDGKDYFNRRNLCSASGSGSWSVLLQSAA